MHPDLEELSRLTPEAFKQRFRGTALERPKRRGLLRNVCVAMGNSGNRAFIPVLEDLLQDEEPLIREHAAWALEQLRDGPAARTPDTGPYSPIPYLMNSSVKVSDSMLVMRSRYTLPCT